MTTGRKRIVQASWYDYPQYYDIALQAYTAVEADFIEAACRKYCPFDARRFLDPACGSGRLVSRFASRGYEVVCFDVSQPALSYLRRRLTRRGLYAETFEADMCNFRLPRRVDAAYCTSSTFRHLLTEPAARSHLECIAESLRPGGIYVLGLHLVSLDAGNGKTERWTEQRGEAKVTVTLRVLQVDLRRRLENIRVCLLVRGGSNELRLRHEFHSRTYTAKQFRRLLGSVPSLELCNAYDCRHDIEQPFALNNRNVYSLLVLRRRDHVS
jgi:SAM-dependent methyltransferase